MFGNGFNVCSWMRTEKRKSEEKSSGKVEIEFVQVKREAAESYTKVIEAFEKENEKK